jgi:predicted dehydrogenase
MCEKPLAANLEQARHVLDTLRGSDRVVLIAENFHYRRDLKRARQLMDEGKLGRVFLIDVTCYYWTDISKGFASTYWRQDNQYRGGAVTDASVHHAALLRELGGEVEQLQAFTKLVHPDMSGIDTMILNLRFRSGALGRLLFAAGAVEAETPFADVTVFGTGGTLWMKDGKLRLRCSNSQDETTEEFKDEDSYYDQLLNFYDAVVNGSPVRSTSEETFRDLQILMRAYDSAESRSVLLLP